MVKKMKKQMSEDEPSKKFQEKFLQAWHSLIPMHTLIKGCGKVKCTLTCTASKSRRKQLNVIEYLIWGIPRNSWKLTRMHARLC